MDWSLLIQHDSNGPKSWLFVGVVQILVQDFRHGEHMHAILLEDGAHGVVASDLAAVARILELILADVLPYLLHCLWP